MKLCRCFPIIFAIILAPSTVQAQYDDWGKAYAEAERLLRLLTLSDKLSGGRPSLFGGGRTTGMPKGIIARDGPAGIDGGFGVSGWVTPQTIASSWDSDLIAIQAKEIAKEFKKKGYNAMFSPTTGPLGRSVWSGRAFEGYGADPYLNGKLFAAAIKAIQKEGVIAVGKHFILNEQETNRTATTPEGRSNSIVDDRTMHEIYLWPWVDGVKSGLGSVMCSMNRVNGVLACENEAILNGLLKKELGFKGYVCPDATAVVNSTAAILAGLDENPMMAMVGKNLESMVARGIIPAAIIDDMVRRIIATQLNINQPADQYGNKSTAAKKIIRDPKSGSLIRRIGADSIVLLKNAGNILPIKDPSSIAVFGLSATNRVDGPTFPIDIFSFLGDTYPGHLAAGGGSAAAPNPYLITPLEALNFRASNGTGFNILTLTSNNPPVVPAPGGVFGFGAPYSIQSISSGSDYCLVFLNAYSKEGADRKALADEEGDLLVKNTAKYCKNTIVILNTAGARVIDAWADLPNVKGVLNAGLLGEQSGNAIMDVLFGDVNPSGRLPYTIAKKAEDYNGKVCACCDCKFEEGLFIDYRHFDQAKIEPRYEFGYGLSYTTFKYSDLQISAKLNTGPITRYATGTIVEGGFSSLFDSLLNVTGKITNTGPIAGKDVIQLYLGFPPDVGEPEKQLRGFQKVALDAGESKTVSFQLQRRDLSIWDVSKQNWHLASGKYTFFLSKSSRKVEITDSFKLSIVE